MPVREIWEILFYWDHRQRKPVAEFLRSVDTEVKSAFIHSLDLLEERGTSARYPLSTPLGNGLFELREEVNTNIYRIIYVFQKGRRIILLHGFMKKSQKTPPGEIEIAEQRKSRVPAFLEEWDAENRKRAEAALRKKK